MAGDTVGVSVSIGLSVGVGVGYGVGLEEGPIMVFSLRSFRIFSKVGLCQSFSVLSCRAAPARPGNHY